MNILKLPMPSNDIEAETIGEYFSKLLITVWTKEESFSGKRAFGNSGWKIPVYIALINAKLVEGLVDSEGYLEDCNEEQADMLLIKEIAKIF